jgi:hypothetical protein
MGMSNERVHSSFPEGASQESSGHDTLESFAYDNAIVKNFAWATAIWSIVGFLVALKLVWPDFLGFIPELSYGRLRPLHTNAVIFAFAGNAIFMGVYYSLQRLTKARMYSDTLSKLHFWGWQLIIVSAALTLPLGFTTSKEYAELEWPIDIAIAAVWVIFGQKKRKTHVCCDLVLYRDIPYSGTSSYRQFIRITRFIIEELLILCRRTRCIGAVVVWTQCSGIFLDNTILGNHVLFYSQSSQ